MLYSIYSKAWMIFQQKVTYLLGTYHMQKNVSRNTRSQRSHSLAILHDIIICSNIDGAMYDVLYLIPCSGLVWSLLPYLLQVLCTLTHWQFSIVLCFTHIVFLDCCLVLVFFSPLDQLGVVLCYSMESKTNPGEHEKWCFSIQRHQVTAVKSYHCIYWRCSHEVCVVTVGYFVGEIFSVQIWSKSSRSHLHFKNVYIPKHPL